MLVTPVVHLCDLSSTRAAAAGGRVRLERGAAVHSGLPAGRQRPVHSTAQPHRHQPHLRQQ